MNSAELGISDDTINDFFETFRDKKVGQWPSIMPDAFCSSSSRNGLITLRFFKLTGGECFQTPSTENALLTIIFSQSQSENFRGSWRETPFLKLSTNDKEQVDFDQIVEALKNSIMLFSTSNRSPVQNTGL